MTTTQPAERSGHTIPHGTAESPSTTRTAPGIDIRRVFVPGNPAPQGSKSFKGISKTSGRAILAESSKHVGPWRKRISAYAVARHGMNPIDSGPVSVRLEFVMPRPKATPKTRTPAAVKRPDIDKLARAVLDATTGIYFRDDSQVVHLAASKRLAEPDETPGVEIRVGAL